MSALIAGIPSWFIPVLILLVSIIALTIILERGWFLLRQIQSIEPSDEKKLLEWVKQKDYTSAIAFCRAQNHPAYARVLAVLEAKEQGLDFRNLAEEEGLKQLSILEKYIPTLGTISTIAPLLGLLGTVTGMIKSFRAFEQSASRSSALMGGIDEALITTALGLIVAIPSLIMYNYYVRRINTLTEEGNILVNMVMEILEE
ncbi:MAG: MotA/TolQ/ExbB proton channel family protein [Candidatus Hydrogenedentota bacterium]|nr:MAG: MotA/TolQ/ExbB proton channel family protein [Candidatus Hydrogenedentota bacterium]